MVACKKHNLASIFPSQTILGFRRHLLHPDGGGGWRGIGFSENHKNHYFFQVKIFIP